MIKNLLISGLFSGIIAGLLLTLVQHFNVLPLILEAEVYEAQTQQYTQNNHGHSSESVDESMTNLQHLEQEWSPQDASERLLFTVMTNVLLGIGFSLVLISLMTTSKHSGWQSGLLWGLAGFSVFYLAPSLGLPPELPGTVHATIENQQLWWIATVVSTAIGFGLLLLNPALTFKIFGILFIVAPHFFSESLTTEITSSAPKELGHSFIIATSIANIIFWSILGSLNGALKSRFMEPRKIKKAAL